MGMRCSDLGVVKVVVLPRTCRRYLEIDRLDGYKLYRAEDLEDADFSFSMMFNYKLECGGMKF